MRHDSFKDKRFYDLARKYNAAIVFAHDEDFPEIDEPTADFTYARLMGAEEKVKTGYKPAELDEWAKRAKAWAKKGDAFVYFISGAKVRNPAAAQALMAEGLASWFSPFHPACASRRSRPAAPPSTPASAARGRPSSCCTASATPATCGRRWRPRWSADHTVVVPDLRGMGLSSHPDGGYDKKTQARDIARVLDALEDRQGRPRHPRHRQHGGLRLRRAVSRRASRAGW